MMYRVLIIDDEDIIVEGLSKIIPWEKHGCEIAGTAGSMEDGKAKIKELNPEIVFTDIRMPDGDGLTMLAGLKSEFPDMQVTVLTGYREFNYAQKAITLGVTRFLLKPSKMDELTEALEEMVKRLNKESGISSEEEKKTDANETQEASSFIVRQAVQYIEEHSAEKISLSDVAEACYVSQWHLSKLLNKYAEQNFYDILNSARIAKAKKLMLDPSLRIGDISEKVGYVDTPHFSRVFKKLEGISANEYRNEKLK